MTQSEKVISEALALSPADRLDVIDRLWSSIASDSDALELSPAQRAELDRRIQEMESDPSAGIPWKDIAAELDGQR